MAKTKKLTDKEVEARRKRLLSKASPFKREAFYALEDIASGNAWARFFGVALFALIVANAVLVFVLVQMNFTEDATSLTFYAISTLIFFVEYLFRIWVADLVYPRYEGIKARLRYIVSPFGIIDLLAFLPSMIAWFFPINPLWRHAINVLRLVRLIKLSRYMRGLRTIGRVVRKSRSEIVAAFLVILLLTVISSILMYEVEHPVQPDKFNSLLTGVYWAITTVTGTGYGDIVPVTGLGRFIGSVTMLLSVGIVAIPGGIFSAGFVAEYQNMSRRRSRSHEASDDEYYDESE